MAKNKEGMGNVTKVVGGILLILFITSLVIALFNWDSSGGDFVEAFTQAIKSVFTAFGNVLGYLLNAEGDNAFIMIVSFILIAVIIVSVLDTANVFGEDNWVVNFVVGIIVAIIGVRFMPGNLWLSLTAPSSAFAATLLVGAPFLALVFLSLRIKSRLANKLIWIFFVIMVSYLIYRYGFGEFKWVYSIFLILGIAMMFFDGTIRSLINKEKEELNLVKDLDKLNAKDRYKMREEIKDWNNILVDSGSSATDKATAKAELSNLRKMYGQDLSKI